MSSLSERNSIVRVDSIESVDFLVDTLNISVDHEPEEERCVSEFRKLEMAGLLAPEPLLIADKARFVLFPIKHNDVSDTSAFFLMHCACISPPHSNNSLQLSHFCFSPSLSFAYTNLL